MPTAKEQQEINKALGKTLELQQAIKKEVSGREGYLSALNEITAKNLAIGEALNEQGKLSKQNAKTIKQTADATNQLAKDYDDIIRGEKEASNYSVLRKEAVKEGNVAAVKQIDYLKTLNTIAKIKAKS